jgi:SRSO17 transposase
VGDEAGYLVIDDTALPKKGSHSVGVAAQYASSLGKSSSCQSLVSVTLASREVPVMIDLRLFLPESWTADRGGSVYLNSPARLLSGASAGFMPLREAVG